MQVVYIPIINSPRGSDPEVEEGRVLKEIADKYEVKVLDSVVILPKNSCYSSKDAAIKRWIEIRRSKSKRKSTKKPS